MKKIAVGIVVILGLSFLQTVPAKAAGETIVIVDSMVDSARPELKNNIVHEVCMTESRFCSGRIMQAEGAGVASAPSNIIYKNSTLRHGTDLALTIAKVDPNARIIFIRTTGIDDRGNVSTVSNMSFFAKPFNWIAENKTKYNIVSVVFSMGVRNTTPTCTYKKSDQPLVDSIKKLTAMNVAVMAGTGNSPQYNAVMFPACITDTVSVGGTQDWQQAVHPGFNRNADTDFFTVGFWNLATGRQIGTSLSNAALAAYWAKNYKGSFKDTYDYLKSIGKPIVGDSAGLFVDVNK